MSQARSLVSLVTLFCSIFLLAPLASAQVTLKRKFPEGSSHSRSVDTGTKQVIMIANMNVETSSQQNLVIKATVGKRNGDGELPIVFTTESLQQTVKAPGLGELSFDSANPDKGGDSPLAAVFKAQMKATWTMTLDRDNRVARVEGREKAFESLDANVREAFKASIDPTHLKQAAQLEIDRIPGKPVKMGDSWEQDETMRLEGGQSLTFHRKYTYQGEVEEGGKKVHKIGVVATEAKLEVDANNPANLKLIKSDLKVGKTEGVLLFDQEAGAIVSDKQTHQIKGSITLGVAGQEFPAELDLTIDTSAVARH